MRIARRNVMTEATTIKRSLMRYVLIRDTLPMHLQEHFTKISDVPPMSNSDADLEVSYNTGSYEVFCINSKAASISMRDNCDVAFGYISRVIVQTFMSPSPLLNELVLFLTKDLNPSDTFRWIRMALFGLFLVVEENNGKGDIWRLLISNISIVIYMMHKAELAQREESKNGEPAQNVCPFDIIPLVYLSEERIQGIRHTGGYNELVEHTRQEMLRYVDHWRVGRDGAQVLDKLFNQIIASNTET